MPRRVAIIGAGVSGLGVAWALNKHPDRNCEKGLGNEPSYPAGDSHAI